MRCLVVLACVLVHQLAETRVPFVVSDADGSAVPVGNSEGWKAAAKLVENSVNFSLDPCEDFFEYACRKFIDANPIPDDLTSYSQFTATREKLLAEMKSLFEDPTTSSKSNSVRVVKQVYAACMDTETQNTVGPRDMLEKVKSFGYWPMLHGAQWRQSTFDLTKLLINVIAARDSMPFIDYYSDQDSMNVSRRMLSFSQSSLGLGSSTRDYYLKPTKYSKQLKAYRTYILAKLNLYAQDAGIRLNQTTLEADVDEMIAFETKWAEIIVPDEDQRNYTQLYNIRKLSEMQNLVPIIDWQKMLLATTPFSTHAYIKSDPDVIITDLDYMKKMSKLLQDTDPRLVTNYILLRFSGTYTREIGTKYEDIQQDFLFAMYGRKQKQPRWKDCVSSASGKLSFASGSMYVKKFFNSEAKNTTLEMIGDLQEAFRNMLLVNDWMDSETRKAALEKAENMLKQIAYPDFILSDEKLDEWYKGVETEPTDTYTQITDKIMVWRNNFNFKRLLEPVNREEFITGAAVVNAFYSPGKNAIAFPAGILQKPFFDAKFPKALNYGAIGAVIGHEITHGFDDTGKQFDNIGNLRDWWDNSTSQKYADKAKCMQDQYAEVKIPQINMNINGKLTLGENIADNGGVKESFKAYQKYLEKHGAEARLPGYEKVTNEQLFYIGYAQVWCGSKTDEAKTNQILTDPHSPEVARVNIVVSNQPEFAQAFNCPAGSPMNPNKRCVVW